MRVRWRDPIAARLAAAGPPNAVKDDAEQDHDHAHETDQVRRKFRGCVLMRVADIAGDLEMRHDVGDPPNDQDQQADPGERREA
jgi:hypothetical protein